MASIKLSDLALSEALDRKAMQSIHGAEGWITNRFPWVDTRVAGPGAGLVEIFNNINYNFQQTINNTYIGKMLNQNVSLSNTASNGTNTGVVITSFS